MTRNELEEYRSMKMIHLKSGIGKIKQRDHYDDLTRRVEQWIASLDDADEADVCRRYYLLGETLLQISFKMNYSDRQIRRIRRNAISRLS